MNEPAIQVNIPWRMLLQNLDFVLDKRINPEIYFSGDALDTCREADMRRVAEALSSRGLSTTVHAPFMDLSPGGMDSKIKSATIERLHQTISTAALFAPNMITFHPGYNRWVFDGDVPFWLDSSLATWRPIVERAEKLNLYLALENVFEEEPSGLQRLIEGIGSPHLGFCYDVGHFHLFSAVSMEAWFVSLGGYMREVHLHDNRKTADDHLPVGDGEINFELFMRLVGDFRVSPIYTIEPHQVEKLERSMERCHHMLSGGTLK
jgi:sugar phosphate isomerase/epimerase